MQNSGSKIVSVVASGVLAASLVGVPAFATGGDDVVVVLDINGQEVPAEFDLDGDGIADMLDLDNDGKPDAKDLNHNGISDEEEEAEKEAADAAAAQAEEEAAAQNADDAMAEATEAPTETEQDQAEAQAADSETPAEAEASEAAEPAESAESAEQSQEPLDDEAIAQRRLEEQKAKRAEADYSELLASGAVTEEVFLEGDEADLQLLTANDLGQISRGHVDMTTEKFIASIGEQARYIGQKRNLYASVLIAQAILESGSGNSTLAQYPNFNLFGIKGDYEGKSVTMMTQEDDGTGAHYDISAGFRVYPSMSASMNDYANLLRMNPVWYSGTWKENAKTWQDAALALQGTYATSTTYASSLASLIKTYDLTQYDEPLPYKVVSSIEETDEGTKVNELDMEKYVDLERIATSFLDTAYVWGGDSDTEGFDCSGLVQWTYRKALGIELPRTSQEQSTVGVEVQIDVNKLRMGDLLFFSNKKEGAFHVAMYLGNGYYIHAPETGDVIKVTSLEEFTPSSARRILQFVDVKKDKKAKKSEKDKKAAKEEKSQKSADADEQLQASGDAEKQGQDQSQDQSQDQGQGQSQGQEAAADEQAKTADAEAQADQPASDNAQEKEALAVDDQAEAGEE